MNYLLYIESNESKRLRYIASKTHDSIKTLRNNFNRFQSYRWSYLQPIWSLTRPHRIQESNRRLRDAISKFRRSDMIDTDGVLSANCCLSEKRWCVDYCHEWRMARSYQLLFPAIGQIHVQGRRGGDACCWELHGHAVILCDEINAIAWEQQSAWFGVPVFM